MLIPTGLLSNTPDICNLPGRQWITSQWITSTSCDRNLSLRPMSRRCAAWTGERPCCVQLCQAAYGPCLCFKKIIDRFLFICPFSNGYFLANYFWTKSSHVSARTDFLCRETFGDARRPPRPGGMRRNRGKGKAWPEKSDQHWPNSKEHVVSHDDAANSPSALDFTGIPVVMAWCDSQQEFQQRQFKQTYLLHDKWQGNAYAAGTVRWGSWLVWCISSSLLRFPNIWIYDSWMHF